MLYTLGISLLYLKVPKPHPVVLLIEVAKRLMTLTGEKRLISKEICPNTTLLNRNPTKPSLSSNQGISGDEPATSRLKFRRVRDGYVNDL
jgi:hypothetical protein